MAAVTEYDEKEGYLEESLKEALDSGSSCRHVARTAHLYISTTPHLTNEDYQLHMPALMNLIFGTFEETIDQSWLTTRSGLPRSPDSFLDVLERRLKATFIDKTDSDKQLSSAFRVAHLLSPRERGNLYDLIFHRPHSQCVYFFSPKRLPPSIRNLFSQWINNMATASQAQFGMGQVLPPSLLLNSLSMTKGELVTYQDSNGLALDLKEYFIFRFFDWFTRKLPVKPIMKRISSNGSTATGMSSNGSTTTGMSSNRPMPTETRTISLTKLYETSVTGLTKGSIPNEILLNYCRDFMPHMGVRNGQQYTLHQEEDFLRVQWLFIQCIIEFWLRRHRTVEKAKASVVSTPPALSSSTRLPQQTNSLPARKLTALTYGSQWPTEKLIKAILIVIVHLQTDPVVYQTPSNLNAGAGGGGAASCGMSPILKLIRPHLFEFLHVNILNIPVTNQEFFGACEIWLQLLQPWTANAKIAKARPPKEQRDSQTEAAVAKVSSVVQSTLARVKTSVAGNGSTASTSSGSSNEPQQNSFSVDWIWFVVQHYLMYTHLLKTVLNKIGDANSSDLRELVQQIFSPEGAFNDGVIAVLRACEIIIQDTTSSEPPRQLVHAVGDKWTYAQNQERLGLTANRASGTHLAKPQSLVQSEMVLRILEELDQERELVIIILKNQFVDFAWNVETSPIPWLVGMQQNAERIQRGLYQYLDTVQVGTESRSPKPLAWWSFQPQRSPKTPTAMSNMKPTLSRIELLFSIPPRTTGTPAKSKPPGVAAKDLKKNRFPETEMIAGSPSCSRGNAPCVYRRLTARGRQQLVTGERVNPNNEFAYVGDSLALPPPVCSYEIFAAVRLLHSASLMLNRLLGLEHRIVKDEKASSGDKAVYRSRFRINLRFLADVRVLLWLLLLFDIVDIVFLHSGLAIWSIPTMAALYASLAYDGTALWFIIGLIFSISFALVSAV